LFSPHFGGGFFIYLAEPIKSQPMKKLLFLLPLLAIISCSDPDNPNRAKFNNSGCLECDNYTAGESFIVGGVRYEVADRAMLETAIADGDDLTQFCVSKVTDMGLLFSLNNTFNQDISNWDVSNVTNMVAMFNDANSFNQDIGSWDVSSVTDMQLMFKNASAFNQDIGNWDVSNVTDMFGMFGSDIGILVSFNQDISSWDVNSVTNMGGMFYQATAFNQDIGNWDVSNVTNMDYIFSFTTAFNQDLTQWCVSNFLVPPVSFSVGSALTASNHPVWGTCP